MKPQSKIEELDDSDEPIREIIGKVPAWIIRWGNTIVLIFFICLFLISYFIHYPESVYSRARLISINAPKAVVVHTTGKLIALSVKEGDSVKKGSVIGFMESTGDHQTVLALSDKIDSLSAILENGRMDRIQQIDFSGIRNLGELQQYFQPFMQARITVINYLSNGVYARKSQMLRQDMGNLSRLNDNLQKQKTLYAQDLSLSQSTFNANQALRDNKVISDYDFRAEESKLISKKLSLPQITTSIINNESAINEKQKELLELDNTIVQQKTIFNEALNTFKSQIEDWKRKYVLIAQQEGQIAFNNIQQVNMQLQEGQIACYVNPYNSQYYAEAYIPQANFGKVQPGQKVLLRFPSYPYQEYGYVLGKIDFVSHIGTDSGYFSKIMLSKDLLTSYKRKIQYRDGMTADVEIITKDLRLIERFYYNIVKYTRQ